MMKNEKEARICQKPFLKMLLFSKNLVESILNRNLATSKSPKRGTNGHRKNLLFGYHQKAMMQFIKKFKFLESHYCRGKLKRVYIQSDVSINRLYKLYCNKYKLATPK